MDWITLEDATRWDTYFLVRCWRPVPPSQVVREPVRGSHRHDNAPSTPSRRRYDAWQLARVVTCCSILRPDHPLLNCWCEMVVWSGLNAVLCLESSNHVLQRTWGLRNAQNYTIFHWNRIYWTWHFGLLIFFSKIAWGFELKPFLKPFYDISRSN